MLVKKKIYGQRCIPTEHAKEMMAKYERDGRMQPLYKQFMGTVVLGSKVVMGNFSRLNL